MNYDSLGRHIGAALLAVRMHQATSQADLARTLSRATGHKVSQSYVCRVETGRTRISWERLALFCAGLKCRPSEVMRFAEILIEQGLIKGRMTVNNILNGVQINASGVDR